MKKTNSWYFLPFFHPALIPISQLAMISPLPTILFFLCCPPSFFLDYDSMQSLSVSPSSQIYCFMLSVFLIFFTLSHNKFSTYISSSVIFLFPHSTFQGTFWHSPLMHAFRLKFVTPTASKKWFKKFMLWQYTGDFLYRDCDAICRISLELQIPKNECPRHLLTNSSTRAFD
jgi:hypothetical protein